MRRDWFLGKESEGGEAGEGVTGRVPGGYLHELIVEAPAITLCDRAPQDLKDFEPGAAICVRGVQN